MRSVRLRFLTVLGLLLLVLVGFAAVYVTYQLRSHAEREARKLTKLAASEVEDKLELFWEEIKRELRFVNSLRSLYRYDQRRFGGVLLNLVQARQKQIRAVYFGTADGVMIERGSGNGFLNGLPLLPFGYDPRTRPWYKKAAAKQGFTVTAPYLFSSYKIYGITAALPRYVNSVLDGVAGIDLSVELLQGLINRIELPYGGRCTLLSETGDLFISQNLPGVPDLNPAKVHQSYKKLSSGVSGKCMLIKLEEQFHLLSFVRNRTTGWLVAALIPYKMLMVDHDRLLTVLLTGLIVLLAVILVFLYMSLGLLLKPVKQLQHTIHAFGKGDTARRAEIYADDEFGSLAVSFNLMAESLVEQNDRIRTVNRELEKRVERRTSDLEKANRDLEKRELLIRKDLEMARRIQLGLIPDQRGHSRPEFSFSGNYNAMDGIGGDIYDIIRVGRNAYGILMGDVSGHGVPAALITSIVKVLFMANAHWGIPAGDICAAVNRDLYALIGDQPHYLAAFFGVLNLENGEFSYCNAGHRAALHIPARRPSALFLHSNATFLGAFPSNEYPTEYLSLDAGDRIVFFTDGIVEARSSEGVFYDEHRLLALLHSRRSLTLEKLVESVLEDLRSFTGGSKIEDDQALLAVEFHRTLQ